MAQKIRGDHDLPTLRILMGASPTGPGDAVFQAVRGRDTPREVARASLAELGFGYQGPGSDTVNDEAISVPDSVLTALREAVTGLGPSPLQPENALWLEFPSPRGILYVAPWERLLAPLGRTMFRLPNHLVRPQAPAETLEVAICSSAPLAKMMFEPPDMIAALAHQYVAHVGHDVRVHVFTDVAWVDGLRARVDSPELSGRVVVHDPAEADSYPRPERTTRIGTSTAVTNPWLCWIRDAMDGRRLDVVHFATHGYLSGERGALAVASTPTLNTDSGLSRFVGSVELTSFLTQLGAWGLGLSGPPDNFSEAGLRELADAVALVLPGVALTHGFENDPHADELGLALQTVFQPGTSVDRALPSTTCWVHPAFVDFPETEQLALHVNVDGSSVFVAGATKEALAHDDSQAWVAAASRNLEMLQVRWLPNNADEKADPAAVTALQNLSNFLDEHVAGQSARSAPSTREL